MSSNYKQSYEHKALKEYCSPSEHFIIWIVSSMWHLAVQNGGEEVSQHMEVAETEKINSSRCESTIKETNKDTEGTIKSACLQRVESILRVEVI